MNTSFALALCVAGCSPSAPTPVTIAGAECVVHRTALQLACDDTHTTKVDIDNCRALVKQAINCLGTDAGKVGP